MKVNLASSKSNENLYACTLLFRYRKNKQQKKFLCDERMFHMKGKSPSLIYKACIKRGKDEEYILPMGNCNWAYEFVGVLEIVELALGRKPDEVWHRFSERMNPERRIPLKTKLSAYQAKLRFENTQ